MTANYCYYFSTEGFGCGGRSVLITSVHIHVPSGHPSACSIGSLRTKFATNVLSTVQSWLDHSPCFLFDDSLSSSRWILYFLRCLTRCVMFSNLPVFSWSKSSPWSWKSDLLLQCLFTQQNLWVIYCVTGLFTVINKLDQKCSQNTSSVP